MSYTIGFDFGTHQTKICVEDSSNPFEKMYEFIAFEKLDGTTSVLFPSIVQINSDDTLSYGFVDKEKCKIFKDIDKKPILNLLDYPPVVGRPRKPIPQYPPRPQVKPWRNSAYQKEELDKWKKKCSELEKEIDAEWKREYNKSLQDFLIKFEQVKKENEKRVNIYESERKEWEKGIRFEFRYFKLNAFIGEGSWIYPDFSAEEITVWYITYILLILKEKYSNDFSIQFGVPVGGNNQRDKIIIDNAYSLYIAAWDLSEKFSSLEEYRSSTYLHLRELTNIRKDLTAEDMNQYIFDDMPEAFAGLIAVTKQRKIGIGFHVLADIGGGTTDMALFYVKTKSSEPDIIYTCSFAQGLNSIFERTKEKYESCSIEELQNKFSDASNFKLFENSIQEYVLISNKKLRSMIDILYKYCAKYSISSNKLNEALRQQPIIYCGGGSLYHDLRFVVKFYADERCIGNEVELFADKRCIDKDTLNIRNLRNEKQIDNNIYSILATSYGLASYSKIGDIVFTDIDKVFDHLVYNAPAYNTKDYGIDDT